MARKVAKVGAAKGGSCRGFSGPGDRCHLAVSKRHRNTIWQQTRPAKGQRVEAGEAYATGMARNVAKAGAATGGSCRVVFQALVTDAIWQFRNDIETPFGNRRGQQKGKGWKLERLVRQAWPGTWQKQVRQRVEAAGWFFRPW